MFSSIQMAWPSLQPRSSSNCLLPPGLKYSPSSDGDHFAVGRHKQLGSMGHVAIALHSDPRVFRSFRIEGEEERFSRAEVGLAVAAIVFLVALTPARRAIGAKHLKIICSSRNRKLCRRHNCHSPTERRSFLKERVQLTGELIMLLLHSLKQSFHKKTSTPKFH